MYSVYYQATVNITMTWFVTGVFRAEDGVAFERTVDGRSDLLEFFVPECQEPKFLQMMNDLMRLGHIVSYEKLPNRLVDGSLL